MRELILMATGAFLAMGVSGRAAEVAPNTWTRLSDEKSEGVVARIVYVPEKKGMLSYGYPAPSSKNEVDLFVTASRKWSGQLPKGAHRGRGGCRTIWSGGRPQLPCINRTYWLAGQACYVPTEKKVLYFAGGSTFYFDPAAKKWQDLKIALDASPPDVMLGSMAWEPVKKRVILFGGGYISAHKREPNYAKTKGTSASGTPWSRKQWTFAEKRATWAFDPAKKAWSKVITGSKELRAAHAKCREFFSKRATELFGAVRGVAFEYGAVSARKPDELAADAAKLAAEVDKLGKDLAGGGGCENTYEKEACRLAAAELGKAKASLVAASSVLKASDGWKALRHVEKARWELFEAAEAVAPGPLPRYYSAFVSDTKNKLLVLFGGHGGNKALCDTWIFDGAKDQWRRSKSKAHPGFDARPAMSFDAQAGLVFYLGGWVFDAAKDEWKTVKLAGGRNGRRSAFHAWKSMCYDPVEKLHVVMSASHGGYGKFGPRRTFIVKLDASKAVRGKPGGRTWKWLNDKYERAWNKLPKTQAEYKAAAVDQKKFLEGLKPNVWAKRTAPYNAQDRSYGSFCYDWDRDQIIFWGGGHSAYMGNEFSHYDVKSNTWMESWAPDLPPWPFGKPDGDGWNPAMYHKKGSAHGYHHYVYNADTKQVAFYAGALFYDVDRMRWSDLSLKAASKGSRGYTLDMSGTKGLMSASARYYRGAPFGAWRADFKAGTLAMIPGSAPAFGASDRAKPVFDSKRKRILWYGVKSGKNRVCNELWEMPLATGKWKRLDFTLEPADAKAPNMGAWGNCYSPKYDIMVILPGSGKQDTWIYDCAKNVLRKAFPGPKTNRWGTNGVVYNAKQDVFMTIDTGSYGTGSVRVHFLRYKAR
jgi:outer membrane murein-binding lipoprotein Lpp